MAVDLRDDINRLVELYMKFVKKEDGILLLSIDDIDLNIDLSTVRDGYIITTPYKSEIDTLRKRAAEAFGTP